VNDWRDLIAHYDPQAVPLIARQEMVWVAALDGQGVRDLKRVAQGGCTRVNVHLAPLLAVPLVAGVDRFTMIHNHPSGSLGVSANDRALTQTVLNAATACGLTMVDHIILGWPGSASLVALGILQAAEPVEAEAAE